MTVGPGTAHTNVVTVARAARRAAAPAVRRPAEEDAPAAAPGWAPMSLLGAAVLALAGLLLVSVRRALGASVPVRRAPVPSPQRRPPPVSRAPVVAAVASPVLDAAPAAPPRDPPPAAREATAGAESCCVEVWRGYVRSQFFARSSAGEVIAESPMFPWRSSDPPPETPQARAAYEELDAALRSRGWAPVRRREQTTWFGSAYTRRAA